MRVHRAADVEEEQQFHRIVPLGPHADVEPALARGAVDRLVEVELLGGALAGEAAQAAQRDLDVAGAELDLVVEVAELALVPDLDRAALAALAADADALGIVALIAERRGAAGADPLAAALVPPLLLLEPLLQRRHDLFPRAERLDLGHLLGGEVELGDLLQPFLGDRHGLGAVARSRAP